MKLYLFVLIALITACSSQKHYRGPSSVCSSEKDCSKTQVKAGNFVLQSRDENGAEIWKDKRSGLTWSDRLPDSMTQGSAATACEALKLGGKSWRLPSMDEFKEANNHKIVSALSNMNYMFWSSSECRGYDFTREEAYPFYSFTFGVCKNGRYAYNSVRCVSR